MKKFEKMVLFDTETTGINFKADRIIEIGYKVLERQDGKMKVTKNCDYFVKHEGVILSELMTERKNAQGEFMSIAELTHISDEMLANEGITEKEMIEIVKNDFFSDPEKTLILAYNSNFDLNMLKETLNRHGYNGAEMIASVDQLDLLTVFKDVASYSKELDETGAPLGHRLDAAVKFYNVSVKNTHRAIDDVNATLAVFVEMVKQIKNIWMYINCFGYNPKFVNDLTRLESIKYYPQSYKMKNSVLYAILKDYKEKQKQEEQKTVSTTEPTKTPDKVKAETPVDKTPVQDDKKDDVMTSEKDIEDSPVAPTKDFDEESRIVTMTTGQDEELIQKLRETLASL